MDRLQTIYNDALAISEPWIIYKQCLRLFTLHVGCQEAHEGPRDNIQELRRHSAAQIPFFQNLQSNLQIQINLNNQQQEIITALAFRYLLEHISEPDSTTALIPLAEHPNATGSNKTTETIENTGPTEATEFIEFAELFEPTASMNTTEPKKPVEPTEAMKPIELTETTETTTFPTPEVPKSSKDVKKTQKPNNPRKAPTTATAKWQLFWNEALIKESEYNADPDKKGTHPLSDLIKYIGKPRVVGKGQKSSAGPSVQKDHVYLMGQELYALLSTNIHRYCNNSNDAYEVRKDQWGTVCREILRALTPDPKNVKDGEVDWAAERKRYLE